MKTIFPLHIAALLLLFGSIQFSYGQSSIRGSVHDHDAMALGYANVLLLQATDSTLVKGAVTEDDGSFLIHNVLPGRYLLSANMVGYRTQYAAPVEIQRDGEQQNLGIIVLEENTEQLDAVTITAKRPLFEQKIDRTIVNVENSITSAGATALEVLERSPGVVVNRQSNALSMGGKKGVLVMINGKINRMPVKSMVQLLDGISADNIDRIELITLPPANLDAEGDAGFINIVLKKNTDYGTNGSYTFSAGYGKGDISAASLNFNYRNNLFNLYGDYSFSRKAQDQLFTFNRTVVLNGDEIETDTRSERDPVQRNHNARLGFDLELGEKTVVGALVSGYDNRWSMDAVNDITITTNQVPDTLINIANDEVNHWQHFGANLNLQHSFKKDEVLNLDLDYLFYDNDNPTNYTNRYFDGSGQFLYEELTRSGKLTPIKIGVGKLDYRRGLGDKVNMVSGVKGTLSRFDNAVNVSALQQDTWVNDLKLTANYKLDEAIAAAYTSFDVQLNDQTNMRFGLRYEYTSSNLGTVEEPDIVDRQYGNLFPSLFISHKFNENNSANLSFSRRITRPTFNDMAPFVIFMDPNTFFSGNPALQPSISNSVKADYSYKTALFSIQYSQEDSAIARFQSRVIPGTNKQFIAAENLKNRKTINLTIAFPVQVTDKWQMQHNLNGSWQQVNTFFDGTPIRVEQKTFRITWINNYALPKDFSVEMVGFYQSKGLWGTAVFHPLGSLNIGIQKKLKDEKGNLRIGVDDILNTNEWKSDSNFPEQNLVAHWKVDFSQRTYKIAYSRNFGNKKLKGARKRATGSEEERRRVN